MNKLLILLVAFAFIGIRCTDDDGGATGENIVIEDLVLTDILKFIPIGDLKSNSKVVFRNIDGTEKVFDVSIITDTIREKTSSGVSYNSEQIIINYKNSFNNDFTISTTISSQYSVDNEVFEFIRSKIVVLKGNNANTAALSLDSDGMSLFSIIHDSFTILDRKFENVYINFPVSGMEPPYSEILYSAEFGVIGFRDFVNNMWVFDRFEN